MIISADYPIPYTLLHAHVKHTKTEVGKHRNLYLIPPHHWGSIVFDLVLHD